MNYRSINDLNACIVANLHRLPRDLDLIVGIPRSGLLAANLIALHLNLPMTDLKGFIESRRPEGGMRLKSLESAAGRKSAGVVLLVDDSVHSGRAILSARQRIADAGLGRRVISAGVFVDPNAVSKVDFYFDTCPMPRIFEWNLMHHPLLEQACVDIDGVLCRDPLEEENDDGAKYEKFLITAEPFLIPSVTIGVLVTCRLEKYRQLTEAWLAKNGVSYQKLVMMDYPDKAARIAAANYAGYKASVYRETGTMLFIESSSEQAGAIAQMAGRDVFCIETREMLNPDFFAMAKRVAREPEIRRRVWKNGIESRMRRWLGLSN